MNIVPLISIKKGFLYNGIDGDLISINELFKQIEKDTTLYVLDYDGLENNTPSLDTYQKLAQNCILWIDDGPRGLNDIMDVIMAGATNITLRENLWPEMNIDEIFELTDDEIYLYINLEYKQKTLVSEFFQRDIGIVVLTPGPEIRDDFFYVAFLKNIAKKHKIYIHNIDQKTISLWEDRGITGILSDVKKKWII